MYTEFKNSNFKDNQSEIMTVTGFKTTKNGRLRITTRDEQNREYIVFADSNKTLVVGKRYTFVGTTYERTAFNYFARQMDCRKITEKRQSRKG